jgi:hypothetical protein
MGQMHQFIMTLETLFIEQFCAQGTEGDRTVEIRIAVNSERQVLTRTGGNSWNKLTEQILLKPKLCLQASSTCILKYYCLLCETDHADCCQVVWSD